MSRRSEYSRLCCFIDESLRPYTEQVMLSLTKESEKDLLIVLSQVLRQIQLWTHEFDCDSDTDVVVNAPASNSICSGGSKPHSEDHHCLTKIVADLMFFLAVDSRYVQHLAGNILVVISEFVVAFGGSWNTFIDLLSVCLELAICSTLSSSMESPTTKAKYSDSDSSNFLVALKPKLRNSNWSSVAGIIRVLRNILKHLKQEFDDQLYEVYMKSISSCLSNMPWDMLNERHVWNGEALRSSSWDVLLHPNVGQPESRILFYGNLVQFFCSLVEQKDLVETTGGFSDRHPVISKISNLVPKLLAWCLGKELGNLCITQYFRHKMLMLIVRLSFQIHLEGSILLSWLQLIHKYFQDLLLLPITQLESGEDDCLEGSPFLVNFSDVEINSNTSRHLHGQAVFLFLRCSFSLVSLRGRSDEQCSCVNLNSCLAFDLNSDLECCSRKKGLVELYEWLQVQLPIDMFVSHELYFERCKSFSLSFLRLYMHEDDILFEVLLQLLCIPDCAERQVFRERRAFQEVKNDMLFHVSNLFNPIHMFHLFLAELLYDHQVLLDYLISKDMGASSAEYLLRCMRIVCNSWEVFVEFSVGDEVVNESACKKRKLLIDGSDSKEELLPASLKDYVVPLSLERECQIDHTYGRECCRSNGTSFEKAKECLLSLKKSVESLHQKNLFPYNPEVLLRRLGRFQELCLKSRKYRSLEIGGAT